MSDIIYPLNSRSFRHEEDKKMIINATDSDFKDYEGSEGLVLVDFWATWCGPCKMMGPVYEEVSNEMPEVKFVKVNVDENQETASKYRVLSIPTIIALKNGQVVDTMVGFKPKAELKAFAEKNR